MSLQVWLPLNGDLRNQGVGKITSISTTPKYRENGKLFQLAIDLSKRVTFTCPNLKNLQDFSIAFWAYVDNVESLAGKTWVDLFGFTDTSSSGSNGTFRFETCYDSSHGIAYYDNTTMALSNYNGRTYTTSKNIWIHCCVVFDNVKHKVYAYRNGVKFATDTHNGGKFNSNGAFYIGETNNIAGMIQDVRIYNHALSSKEVKEISKGLVLHYKLDGGPTCPPKNLLLNSKKDAGKSHTTYNIADFNFSQKLINGDHYTIIAKVNTSSEKKRVGFYHSGSTIEMGGWQPISSNGIYKVSFIATSNMASQTSGSGYGFCRVYTSNNNGNQGSTPLSGTANVEWITLYWGTGDSIYTSAEEYDGICYDSSGYGNNGNIIGTLAIGKSTPKYNNHIYMYNTNTSNRIECPVNFLTEQLTVSFWVKLGEKRGQVLFAMPTTQCCLNSAGTYFYVNANSAPGYSASNVNANQWYFFTIVKNNTNYSFYINGSQIQASGGNNNWTHNGNKLYLLNRNYNNNYAAEGSLSDFRIYATALSDEEIQKLYNTSGAIDNSGNLYTRELVE